MTDLIAHGFNTLTDATTLAQLIRRQRALSKVTVECYLHHAGKVSSDTMEYLTNSEYHTRAAVESLCLCSYHRITVIYAWTYGAQNPVQLWCTNLKADSSCVLTSTPNKRNAWRKTQHGGSTVKRCSYDFTYLF